MINLVDLFGIEYIIYVILVFIGTRILHRCYFLVQGHQHHFSYDCKAHLEYFLSVYCDTTHRSSHQFTTSSDGTIIRYLRLGRGAKAIVLLNGVGTGFFMWLPILKILVSLKPSFFDEYTLFVPSYRGLFGSCLDPKAVLKKSHSNGHEIHDDNPDKYVRIKVSLCVQDVFELLAHAKVESFDTIIGWSTGAQVALSFLGICADNETTRQRHQHTKLVLLNPSVRDTLKYVFQPFHRLPLPLAKLICALARGIIVFLQPFIFTYVWDVLKFIALSSFFRLMLEISAFFGGFPPEQPVYFHEYMRDAFSSREHTLGLLNLILALDDDCHPLSTTIENRSLILAGYPDFITGVYCSYELAQSLKRVKLVVFTMGSHFLLLEWPDIVAKEILTMILSEPMITSGERRR
jgi:pimeloyl-ACP methyl ester carboxylesterase